MIIDFSVKLIGIDGKPINDGAKDVTLKDVALIALVQDGDDTSKSESVEQRMKRMRLAEDIFNVTDVNLSVEEVALIKQRIPHFFRTPIMFAAFKAIEGC